MVKEYATRDIKLETIRLSIVECSSLSIGAIKEKVITECSVWWGLRRQSAQELITQLISQEEIIDDNGTLWGIDRWEKIGKAREKDYLKMEDILKGYAQKQL